MKAISRRVLLVEFYLNGHVIPLAPLFLIKKLVCQVGLSVPLLLNKGPLKHAQFVLKSFRSFVLLYSSLLQKPARGNTVTPQSTEIYLRNVLAEADKSNQK